MGRREEQKEARRARIAEAARSIFAAKGYDGATTREIAARAGVGAGTLFAYAPDKGTLLRAMFREDLARVTERSFATVPRGAPLLDQLVHIFRARFAFWAKDVPLSRHAMREVFSAQYRPGSIPEGERYEISLKTRLLEMIQADQRVGGLSRREDPVVIARMALYLYLSECREWILEPAPRVEDAVARLREALALAFRGSERRPRVAAKRASPRRSSARV
jgi:AcrR family transcriptional regulator